MPGEDAPQSGKDFFKVRGGHGFSILPHEQALGRVRALRYGCGFGFGGSALKYS
jgi:hypothetical protein